MHRCVLWCLSCFLAVGLVVQGSAANSVLHDEPGWKLGSVLPVPRREGESTESLWRKAKAAMDQGNFSEARPLLRQAVQQDPTDGALWFHLGASCAELNEIDEAIAAFERARSLAPRQPDTYFNLGLMYWRKGDVNKAKESYRAGLALRPKETSALRNYSLLLMKTGDYRAAVEPLQRLDK